MTVEPSTDSNSQSPAEPVAIDGQAALDEFVAENDVVLADFYADWCGPCKMLEPTVEGLAADTDAAVAKVDVDANQPLAQAYGVRGVPTLVLFAGGEKVEEVVGVQSEDQLRSLIERYA
ncbi:thioredoxin [Haloarcula nitratireducens]|uniref:Thioredoxin n=1 Tax=Haloarcula nitratireducens TaxID=2487749 RepID=A0AAW4P6B1_9EURY|nr:thioredoxin [Halomicroarcula nitratireducens]MBX0293299.1 thioredoxin [Halomicroarcula nitratireducens]